MDKAVRIAYVRYPEKAAARRAIYYAVKVGKLVKPDACEKATGCSGRLEAHHADYSQKLAVDWLCTRHHNEVHQP